ncbi:hypothetical protein BC938DRAFT_471944 [Jimgerdemannia flammicorona]|uniref:Zn(2)-C6 fungal-type domain-containing protein n=1 Tax=Jimgerdemannia flammicorona TaxID=994334 RepID=A0A433Q720_9FUNG|nr:hypothetical protein BC938DRAFT_471944 [Jimgerdemannia flammicorona]
MDNNNNIVPNVGDEDELSLQFNILDHDSSTLHVPGSPSQSPPSYHLLGPLDMTSDATQPVHRSRRINKKPAQNRECTNCQRKKRCPLHATMKITDRIAPGMACNQCKKKKRKCKGIFSCPNLQRPQLNQMNSPPWSSTTSALLGIQLENSCFDAEALSAALYQPERVNIEEMMQTSFFDIIPTAGNYYDFVSNEFYRTQNRDVVNCVITLVYQEILRSEDYLTGLATIFEENQRTVNTAFSTQPAVLQCDWLRLALCEQYNLCGDPCTFEMICKLVRVIYLLWNRDGQSVTTILGKYNQFLIKMQLECFQQQDCFICAAQMTALQLMDPYQDWDTLQGVMVLRVLSWWNDMCCLSTDRGGQVRLHANADHQQQTHDIEIEMDRLNERPRLTHDPSNLFFDLLPHVPPRPPDDGHVLCTRDAQVLLLDLKPTPYGEVTDVVNVRAVFSLAHGRAEAVFGAGERVKTAGDDNESVVDWLVIFGVGKDEIDVFSGSVIPVATSQPQLTTAPVRQHGSQSTNRHRGIAPSADEYTLQTYSFPERKTAPPYSDGKAPTNKPRSYSLALKQVPNPTPRQIDPHSVVSLARQNVRQKAISTAKVHEV